MPIRLRKKLWIIPPFLYLNASNSGLSWTAKLGPWSWNSRTKRQRVDLPGPISWVGKTRGQRAKARREREAKQAARSDRAQRQTEQWAERVMDRMTRQEEQRQERARWDAYFRNKEHTATGAQPGTGTPEQQGERRNGTRRTGTGTAPRPEQNTRGGLCGQRTQDGTPCQRRGRCAPGTHAVRRR